MIQKITISTNNWEPGRKGQKIEAIVIHIMQGSLIGTDAHFQNHMSSVSSHEGIGKNGDVHVYVESQNTAYHSGRVFNPNWKLIKSGINPNSYTYGIENEGFRDEHWTDDQMISLVERVKKIVDENKIPIDRDHIISHHEIAADKENMSSWCDEIIKRLNMKSSPIVDKEEIKHKIIDLLKIL